MRGELCSALCVAADELHQYGRIDGLTRPLFVLSKFDVQHLDENLCLVLLDLGAFAVDLGDAKLLGVQANFASGKEVFDGFEAAISEREGRGEVVKSTFVGIEKADITQASVRDSEVQITLRIVSQLISATYDRDGKLVDGDPDAVAEVDDIWTFSRDIRSRDPNWKLIATESEQ